MRYNRRPVVRARRESTGGVLRGVWGAAWGDAGAPDGMTTAEEEQRRERHSAITGNNRRPVMRAVSYMTGGARPGGRDARSANRATIFGRAVQLD